MENRALGKGLSALIPEKSEEKNLSGVDHIDINKIDDNRLQPRSNYDTEKLEFLKSSIKERGVLQPIIVREKDGRFEVVAGERRLRASRSLGLEKIPALVKDMSDQEALVVALIENIQREDLNPIEEALAYKRLIEDFHYTQDSVASSVSKDRSTISNLLRLLKLPDNIQKSVFDGELSVGHARALLAIDSANDRNKIFEKVLKEKLSVRALEILIQSLEKGISRVSKEVQEQLHELKACEDQLQKLLGTKVKVSSSKKRGKITIEYYSLDDMERIINLIKK